MPEAAARFPEHAEAIAAYDLRWHETVLGPIDGTVRSSRNSSPRGTPLYAITNFNQDKFRETLARFSFLGAFRDIVVSGDERISSRTRRSTGCCWRATASTAASCVFIDDSPKNVPGAEAVGMKAIHFTTPEALRAELSVGLL